MTAAVPDRRHKATGTLTVALAPREAFRLFTPRGERDWVAGWEPHFPASATDDTDPGTVFMTSANGQTTTWVVIGRVEGRTVSYARVLPGVTAGTVNVTLRQVDEGTEVTVGYDLTALSSEAEPGLRDFVAGFPAFLKSWQSAISTMLAATNHEPTHSEPTHSEPTHSEPANHEPADNNKPPGNTPADDEPPDNGPIRSGG